MRLAYLCLAACLSAVPAWSADKPQLEPLPYIPPPPGMVDQDMEPQITITQKGEDKVEEFRIKGRLYLIKVTPSHGKSYYLVDTRGDGLMRRYDDLSPNFMVPMWVIHQF
jgi:hypothetical protein